MARSHIAFPLALLLSVSPGLSFFVPLVCCCDGDLPGFHLHNGQHARQDRDHVEGRAPEASDQSVGHHHASHQSHDTNQASNSHSGVVAGSAASSSSPCLCSAVGLRTRQEAALLKASGTNRTFRNLAAAQLASATQVPPKRLHVGTYAGTAGGVCPAGLGLYVINRSLLI